MKKSPWRRFCNRMKADALFAYLVTGVSICFVTGIIVLLYANAIGYFG